MPGMRIVVPHNLDQAEVMSRIRTLLQSVREDYGDQISDLQEMWTDSGATFSFRAMSFGVSGNLTVSPSDVAINGQLPLAAMMFKGKIESTIRKKAETLLASDV